MKNPLELLELIHRETNEDSLVKELMSLASEDAIYAQLNKNDAEQLLDFLLKLAASKKTSLACSIATSIKMMTDLDLTSFLECLLQKKSLGNTPFLFQGATAQVRDKLIERVAENPDAVLSALAWIGDLEVISHFVRWKNSPPGWTSSIFTTADKYAQLAGWEVTEEQTRRELCSNTCIPIVRRDGKTTATTPKIFVDAPGCCPWCQRNLANMFAVGTGNDTVDQIIPTQKTFNFLVCEACVWPAGVIFTQVNYQSEPEWSNLNVIGSEPHYDTPSFPRQLVQLGDSQRNPYFSAVHTLEKGISQIGGHPSWLQDAEYPNCPGCAQTMMFFGQVSFDDFTDWEGTFYSFACTHCENFFAVTFQAT